MLNIIEKIKTETSRHGSKEDCANTTLREFYVYKHKHTVYSYCKFFYSQDSCYICLVSLLIFFADSSIFIYTLFYF